MSKNKPKIKPVENPSMLRPWIPLEKLEWFHLSSNPGAIDLLKANPDNIHWEGLSRNRNPRAIDLLKANPDKIHWGYLSTNPGATDLLNNAPPEKTILFDWFELSANPGAIDLLKKYPHRINWCQLSRNPGAIDLLRNNPEKIFWNYLCQNPGAIDLLEKAVKDTPEKISVKDLARNPKAIPLLLKIYKENKTTINWCHLASNPNAVPLFCEALRKYNRDRSLDDSYVWSCLSRNPGAMELLKQNPEKIDWTYLSENPNAIDLLEKAYYGSFKYPPESMFAFIYTAMERFFGITREKPKCEVDFLYLSLNPAIFIDYPAKAFEEELLQNALHPRRIARICDLVGENCEIDLYI